MSQNVAVFSTGEPQCNPDSAGTGYYHIEVGTLPGKTHVSGKHRIVTNLVAGKDTPVDRVDLGTFILRGGPESSGQAQFLSTNVPRPAAS